MRNISLEKLTNILDLTIKQDNDNKVVTFLCMLTAYTEGDQFNVSFNAPSSAGKSFVAMEVAKLFPEEDVIELAYASPASFFHDGVPVEGEPDKTMKDLSRKIILFLDMPDTTLLARLRPILSHDKKIIESKITDRSEKKGMRTKRILIQGYPSVVFCSATLKMDEQEATRLFLLSPEISQEKIEAGIDMTISKEADNQAFKEWINSNPDRTELMDLIIKIKGVNINEIKLENKFSLKEAFMDGKVILKPRHQRDIKRFISLVKAHALLNVFNRRVEEGTLYATDEDLQAVVPLWSRLSMSQELNLPPYVHDIYSSIIEPVCLEKNEASEILTGGEFRIGVTRIEILQKHKQIKGVNLNPVALNQQILPVLEAGGLITQEFSETDRRNKLVFLTKTEEKEYINEGGGVTEIPELDLSDIPF